MNIITTLVYILIISVPLAITVSMIGKGKGRSTKLWFILSLIPIFNIYFLLYAIGSKDLNLERKIDILLSKDNL